MGKLCIIKGGRYISSILLMLLSFSSIAASTNQPISLSEAVNLALKNNPRISASKAKIDAASAAITESRGSGFPKLNMEVDGSKSNNPLTVFANKLAQGNAAFSDFGANQYTGPSALNIKPSALDSPSYYTNWNTAIVLNIPLFSGGATLAKLKKSESLLKAAEHGNQYAKTELTYEVLQAYEGVHVAENLVQVAKSALNAANDYVKITKSLHEQSLVTQSDVLMAENYHRSAQATLEAAIAENNNQLETFRILIGKQESNYVPGILIEITLPKKSFEMVQNQVKSSNAQIQTLKSNLEASLADIKSSEAHYWPQFNLQLRHEWNAKHLSLVNASNSAMISMNWELFSSGEQIGATNQAVAQYELTHAELDNASNIVKLSVSQALRAIQTAKIQLETSKENAKKSIEIVNETKRRYGQGLITLGQLLDAQSRLDTAKAQVILARYNLLLAKAKLLGLTNELIPKVAKS